MEEWASVWASFWQLGLVTNLTAIINKPLDQSEFNIGERIDYDVTYVGLLFDEWEIAWSEEGWISTEEFTPGEFIIRTGYGIEESVAVFIKASREYILKKFANQLEEQFNKPHPFLPEPFAWRTDCIRFQLKAIRKATGKENYNKSDVNPKKHIPDTLVKGVAQNYFILEDTGDKQPFTYNRMLKENGSSWKIGDLLLIDIDGDGWEIGSNHSLGISQVNNGLRMAIYSS